jgi:hypothetical protein
MTAALHDLADGLPKKIVSNLPSKARRDSQPIQGQPRVRDSPARGTNGWSGCHQSTRQKYFFERFFP